MGTEAGCSCDNTTFEMNQVQTEAWRTDKLMLHEQRMSWLRGSRHVSWYSFRNSPPQRMQRASREHGGCPQTQICFRSTSTFCEAKCTSFFRARRPASQMSADRPIAPPRAKLICVSKGRRNVALVNLHAAGSGVERLKTRVVLARRGRAERKGRSQQLFGWTGDERTLESRCDSWTKTEVMLLGSTALIAVLLALSCTLCVNVLLRGWVKTVRVCFQWVRSLQSVVWRETPSKYWSHLGIDFQYQRQELKRPHSHAFNVFFSNSASQKVS